MATSVEHTSESHGENLAEREAAPVMQAALAEKPESYDLYAELELVRRKQSTERSIRRARELN